MNESIESGTEEMGVITSQRETDVIKEPASEGIVEGSPFGSAAMVNEEEAVRELAPILDLPEPEVPSANMAPEPEAPALETASVPAEEYELPRMGEPVVEESLPEVTSPTMSAEQPIAEDPIFGPLKRLLVDLVGEG